MCNQKTFINALNNIPSQKVPFWFMRQAGRYLPEYRELRTSSKGFLDLCYTPEKAAEVTLQPVRRFGMSAAILFSDILVVPHAMGWDVAFVEGEGPKLTPFRELKQLSCLMENSVFEKFTRIAQTIELVKSKLPPDTALIGFSGSPWTVACYMVEGGGSRDFDTVRRFSIEKKDVFQHLIDRITKTTIAYLSGQIEAGADAIQLFDSWAGVLPENDFFEWVITPTKKIIKEIKNRFPEIPIIGFPRMAGAGYARYAKETGVDGVSLDFTVPLSFAKEALQPHAVLQGNLDPLLLAADLPRAIEQAKRIIETLGEKPFVFNLGHGMVPHTPPSHVLGLSEFIRDIRL